MSTDIMSTDLTTVFKDEKLSSVEVKMIKNDVGGLPVVDKDFKLIGIITHRDIQISKRIIGSKVYKCDDLMSKKPLSCDLNSTLPDIVKKMTENHIERIPITDENNVLKGIIVHADVIMALANYFEK